MSIKRHIIIQAVKTKENELIPIWDERLTFSKTEAYGNTLNIKDSHSMSFNTIDCIYDLKTRKVEVGIELNWYPEEDKLEFKKGEKILVEKSHRKLTEAVIADIVFEEYELEIKRGRKLDKWWVDRFKDVEIDGDSIYAIKTWKPFYILEDGTKIEWVHELYHKL